MKPWSQFFRDMLPELPGCPDPVMEHALLRAAQEFFQTTQLWTLWLDNTRTAIGVTEYDIELEPKSELVKLLRATLDGRSIMITTPECLPDDWQTYQGGGLANCIFTRDRKTINLLPRSTERYVLRVEAAVRPSDEAIGIEDDLFSLYAATIATGAKARLMVQAEKAWSRPSEALRYEGLFTREMSRLHFQKMRGFSSARPRARVSTF